MTLFSTESCSPSRGRLPVWLALLDPSYQSRVPMLPVSQGTAPTLFSLESYLVPAVERNSHSYGLLKQLHASRVGVLPPKLLLLDNLSTRQWSA